MGTNTPLEALYALFKGEFGLNHHAFSQLILSDRPYRNGLSPQQMSMNTSWLSRSVVHAPMDSIQSRLFVDFPTAARRVHSRLAQADRDDGEIFHIICGSDLMPAALCATSGQSGIVYRNVLMRLEALPAALDDVKARASLLLAISVGCTGNVSHAVDLTMSYVRADGRVSGRLTPSSGSFSVPPESPQVPESAPESIGLVRLIGGRVASNFYVVPSSAAGSVIGALALGDHAIADVDIDVSAEHLRVYREGGHWLACDLGSKNGTALLPADGRPSQCLVAGVPVGLHPGDRLRLASSTTFAVMAMAKSVRGGGR